MPVGAKLERIEFMTTAGALRYVSGYSGRSAYGRAQLLTAPFVWLWFEFRAAWAVMVQLTRRRQADVKILTSELRVPVSTR